MFGTIAFLYIKKFSWHIFMDKIQLDDQIYIIY